MYWLSDSSNTMRFLSMGKCSREVSEQSLKVIYSRLLQVYIIFLMLVLRFLISILSRQSCSIFEGYPAASILFRISFYTLFDILSWNIKEFVNKYYTIKQYGIQYIKGHQVTGNQREGETWIRLKKRILLWV